MWWCSAERCEVAFAGDAAVVPGQGVVQVAGRGRAPAPVGGAAGAAGADQVLQLAAGLVSLLLVRVLARAPGDGGQAGPEPGGEVSGRAGLAGDLVQGVPSRCAPVRDGVPVRPGHGDAPPCVRVVPGGAEQVHGVLLVQGAEPGQFRVPGRPSRPGIPGHDQHRVNSPAAPPAPARARTRTRTRMRVLARTPARVLVRVRTRILAPVLVRVLARVLAGDGAAEEEVQDGLDLELPGGSLRAGGVQVQGTAFDVLPRDRRIRRGHLPGGQPGVP